MINILISERIDFKVEIARFVYSFQPGDLIIENIRIGYRIDYWILLKALKSGFIIRVINKQFSSRKLDKTVYMIGDIITIYVFLISLNRYSYGVNLL